MPGALGRIVPPDWRHVENFPLTGAFFPVRPTPAVIGVNWYCLAPGQRVLKSDLTWHAVETLAPGDELIGFDEHASGLARYRRSTVTANPVVVRPRFEIATDRGRVVVSSDHAFVQCFEKSARRWTAARDLEPGDRLAYFMDPFEPDDSWEAGWLSGFYDGEGSLAGYERHGIYRLDLSQAVGPTLEKAERLLTAKGYTYRVIQKRRAGDGRPAHWRDADVIYIQGGYNGALRFLGQIRPERLLARAHLLWEGRGTVSRGAPPVTVQSVRALGDGEVYGIGTSTHTLVVEGLLSHNTEFDNPQQDSQGHWWIARDGKLTKIRAGHCVCLKERSGPDLDQWWDFYDQGVEGSCIGFGVSRLATHLNKKLYDARWLYHEAQKIDSRPGENYEGTTVRAGLDILRKRGHRVIGPDGIAARPDVTEGIIANRWAQNIEDVLRVLGYSGLDYVDIMNSWGRAGYPHLVRMPATVLDRLRREEGEIGLVTDR